MKKCSFNAYNLLSCCPSNLPLVLTLTATKHLLSGVITTKETTDDLKVKIRLEKTRNTYNNLKSFLDCSMDQLIELHVSID
jgi:hypothetical protein